MSTLPPPLLLRFPDGSEQPLHAGITHGRGTHASLTDVHLSRQQLSLALVEGQPPLARLTNLARNPMVVQVLRPGSDPAQETSWELAARLQQGKQWCVGPGTRFFVHTRQHSTTLTIMSSSEATDDAAAPAATAGAASGGAKRRRPAAAAAADCDDPTESDAALAAALAAAEEAGGAGADADDTDAAAATPSVGRVWWLSPAKRAKARSHGSSPSPAAATPAAMQAGSADGPAAALSYDCTESDAALAAALAAEEAQAAAADAPGAVSAAAAAAGGFDPTASDAALAAALAAEEEAEAAVALAAGFAGDSSEQQQASNCEPPPQPPPPFGESPISLFAVNDHPSVFSPAWNAGCLGAQLSDLVAGDIQTALVSNFMFDWQHFPATICPQLVKAKQVVIVEGLARRQKGHQGVGWQERAAAIAAQAQQAFAAAAVAAGLPPPELLCHSPEVEAYGCHHSKFFVLGYADGGVRVIVHTANMLFGDCFRKTQGLWWQDFPPSQQQQQQENGQQQQQGPKRLRLPPGFGQTLADYAHELRLPGVWGPRVRQLVAGADYSAARGVLIGSVPGRHEGAALNTWGHMAVRSALAQQTFPARFRRADTVLQSSSLGTVNQKWINELRDSMNAAGSYSPPDATDAAAAAVGGNSRAAAGGSSSSQPGQHKQTWLSQAPQPPRLHFVWPTAEAVRQSVEGWTAGNSIPTYKNKVSEACLQPLFRRWGGTAVGRQEAMPHIKSFGRFIAVPASSLARGSSTSSQAAAATSPQAQQQQQQQQQQAYELPWWLVTSHNLSKSAWGQLQKDGRQLSVCSYELGVLCLPSLEAAYRRHPHRLYCCTPQRPGVVPASCQGPVRFVAWNQPPQQPPQQQQPSGPRPDSGNGTPPLPAAAAAPAPPPAAASAGPSSSNGGGSSSPSQEALVVYVPVPYTLPPQPYNHLQADRPWCLDDPFPGVDRFGRRCPNAPHKARVPYHKG